MNIFSVLVSCLLSSNPFLNISSVLFCSCAPLTECFNLSFILDTKLILFLNEIFNIFIAYFIMTFLRVRLNFVNKSSIFHCWLGLKGLSLFFNWDKISVLWTNGLSEIWRSFKKFSIWRTKGNKSAKYNIFKSKIDILNINSKNIIPAQSPRVGTLWINIYIIKCWES